jgi:hypothetical protein
VEHASFVDIHQNVNHRCGVDPDVRLPQPHLRCSYRCFKVLCHIELLSLKAQYQSNSAAHAVAYRGKSVFECGDVSLADFQPF